MKKVFLLFGIAAFSGASAQQKDLFDIQQHLQKKQAEDKKVAEKKINPFPYNNHYSGNIRELSYTLPNGDKIFNPPLGSMPCVKPDMRNFLIMPNLANGKVLPGYNYYPQKVKPGQIPNGSRPYRMIASK
jgi:hypothetical protein